MIQISKNSNEMIWEVQKLLLKKTLQRAFPVRKAAGFICKYVVYAPISVGIEEYTNQKKLQFFSLFLNPYNYFIASPLTY